MLTAYHIKLTGFTQLLFSKYPYDTPSPYGGRQKDRRKRYKNNF